MSKKCLKTLALSFLVSTSFFVGACSCNAGKVKITFVSEGNNDIIRYVKKGKSLYDLPKTPDVKGKYCVWDQQNFENISEDMVVNALCYSTVTNLYTNIPDQIDVSVSSPEAELDYIFKDAELEVTFESGEKKKLYKGDYSIEASTYNKDKSGSYTVSVTYNNVKKDVKINVNKLDNYVTVSLNGGFGYYNEGLPELVANTEVKGSVSFDEGQTLHIGTNSYSWTFTPDNLSKYAIVKGTIDVTIKNASEIVTNKTSLTVDFNTSKAKIIEKIADGLIVSGKYGNAYKNISPQYYTIDSTSYVAGKSGVFDFKVSYDSNLYAIIPVIVEKCKNYDLSVSNIDTLILKEGITLNDLISSIEIISDIEGDISFVEGQVLTPGRYEYDYVFTPKEPYVHYVSKEGKIRINAYKAQSMDFTTVKSFKYGTTIKDVLTTLKEGLSGTIVYNDGYSLPIDTSKITIEIMGDYNNLKAGEYPYIIAYDNQINVEASFSLEKRVLTASDFTYHCATVDSNNPEIMPICTISASSSSEFEFDASRFNLVPISHESLGNKRHRYLAELVPNDEEYSNNYAVITIEIIAFEEIGI